MLQILKLDKERPHPEKVGKKTMAMKAHGKK